MKTFKTYIGGKWIETGKTIDVIDKYTSEVIGKVPKAGKDEVNMAIEAAKTKRDGDG